MSSITMHHLIVSWIGRHIIFVTEGSGKTNASLTAQNFTCKNMSKMCCCLRTLYAYTRTQKHDELVVITALAIEDGRPELARNGSSPSPLHAHAPRRRRRHCCCLPVSARGVIADS